MAIAISDQRVVVFVRIHKRTSEHLPVTRDNLIIPFAEDRAEDFTQNYGLLQ